jgi:predicted dithiol-disulfide oxidoreductase (DUF899 family)
MTWGQTPFSSEEDVMTNANIVGQDEWLAARLDLLKAEKALDRQRDELSKARRELPRVRVETEYVFEGVQGAVAFGELFGDRHQLIVYHFMYHPSWEVGGCPSCSYLADHFDGMLAHLAQRDTSFVAVSKAEIGQIESYKTRMGWTYPWVSSANNDFNRAYEVSFTPEELAGGVRYNYRDGVDFPAEEAPGASVFYRDDEGEIFHTYSTYARGLDHLIGTYHFLDLTPKGRDEDELPYSMAWIRRHDEYE